MKFVADINIPQLLIRRLLDLDHDVLDIKKHNLQISDTEIIKISQKQSRVILTRDQESTIHNSLTIIKEDIATSYQHPLPSII